MGLQQRAGKYPVEPYGRYTDCLGRAEQIPAFGTFDIVFANINRNILLNDINRYVGCMKPGATLFMSGFYTEDIPAIQAECERNGLKFISHAEKNNWVAVKTQKP